MNTKSNLAMTVALLALSLAAQAKGGCQMPPAAFSGVPETLVTLDKHKGNFVRFDADASWSAYRQLRFSPAVYEPSNPEHGLRARDEKKIRTRLDASLQRAFKNGGTDEGAALLIKPVITDVKRTSTLANVVSFAALQVVVSYGAASVRFELVDAATGRQVGEITSRRNARPWNVYPWDLFKSFEALGQSSVILQNDAKRLRKDLRRLTTTAGGSKSALTNGAE